jgi:hypothetical protein
MQFDSSMQGGAHDLVVACGLDTRGNVNGVYVREFRRCYSWSSLIGAGQCAVVVNRTDAPVTIGGSPTNPWRYSSGVIALSQPYNEALVLSGHDMVTDGCSTISGCKTGEGTDLNFAVSFKLFSTSISSGDASYLFRS